MKVCLGCGDEKSLDEFYADKKVKDGKRSLCISCWKVRYPSKPYAERLKRDSRPPKVSDQERLARKALSNKRYRADPALLEKARARERFRHEIKMGRVQRQPCEVCGEEPGQAHHDDYSKPLDVRWLCRLHHDEIHVQIRRERAREWK